MSELGPEARSILEAGRAGDDPTGDDRARVRGALMRAIAAGSAIAAVSTVSEGAAVAATSKVGGLATGGLAWKLAGGAAILGAILAGIALSRGSPEAPAQVANAPSAITPISPSAAEAPSLPQVATASPPPTGLQALLRSPDEDPLRAAEPMKQGPSRAAPAPPLASADCRAASPKPSASAVVAAPAVPAEDPLEAENRLLREAHGALQKGDADKALALLDERAEGNAGGQLREERAAARVLALCKAGRGAEARARAAEFLRANPRSPHADRVRGACPLDPAP